MQFKGDVDNDGKITIMDALLALKGNIGLVTLTDEEIARADINGDGELTIVDARYFLKHIIGEALIDEVIE